MNKITNIHEEVNENTLINLNDDAINPSHYKQGKYETIEIIEDILGKEKFEGYLLGNIIKYLSRYEHKNGLEDLDKARTYLKWLADVVADGEDKI